MQNSPASRSSSRHPRWTRDETLILTEAKQAYENQCNTPCLGRPLESKWTYVSSYFRERVVERGPLQCRKRWSNLAWDFKRIKAWEMDMAKSGRDQSYWLMRSDVRREKKLPGFFYREVFEMMMVVDRDDDQGVNVEVKEEEVVFDQAEEAEEEMLATTEAMMTEPVVVVPISERKYLPENEQYSDAGKSNDNAKANKNESAYSSREGKRRRTNEAGAEETCLESKLIEVLENNSKILSAQFEAYNLSSQLDREERKDQTDGLIAIMTRIADALGKIADKL